MNYAELTGEIVTLGPFASPDDARLALSSTLETLGFVLPERLVEALKSGLPKECNAALSLGRSLSQRHPRVADPAEPLSLGGQTLERVQEVCGVLGKVLAPELVQDLVRELPPPLASAVEGRPAYGSAHAHAHASSQSGSGARHLSEARIGSANSLSRGRPPAAQHDSVAEPNPHQDTKLSSARGLTQEREGESLASTSPSHK